MSALSRFLTTGPNILNFHVYTQTLSVFILSKLIFETFQLNRCFDAQSTPYCFFMIYMSLNLFNYLIVVSWEKNYFANGGYRIYEFISSDAWLPTILPSIIVIIYLFAISWGERYMRDRKPWQWKNQLAVWNFSLSLFSFCGMIRLLPPIIHYMKILPLRENICGDAYGRFVAGSSGAWIQFFTLSKFP